MEVKRSAARKVPFVIHLSNLVGLLALGLILLLSLVVRPWHLIVLAPVLMLLILYLFGRGNQNVVAGYFALSMSLAAWIVLCENIVSIDNLLGSRITSKLRLSLRLQAYVDANITNRVHYIQECCNDTLSYNFKPGSIHRMAYDCDACNAPYQVMVDETGYLNQRRGLWQTSKQIDVFVAGDSVMQGFGSPSVLELVRDATHAKIWNLSMAGYGPRQRINALISYALPKQPKWLIVEFYSGNDVSDAIEYEMCERLNDLRCVFNVAERHRELSMHPMYGPMLVQSPDKLASLTRYSENYLTLAVTGYFADAVKNTIRKKLFEKTDQPLTAEKASISGDHNQLINPDDVSRPAAANVEIRPERLLDWARAGMAVTHKDYSRLVASLRELQLKHRPKVILLYNPSGYEVYRDILLDRKPKYDRVSEFQIEAQRSFAKKNGWVFLDLTTALRKQIHKSKAWIYGRYDGTHWSPSGTASVANALSGELLTAMSQ